MTKQISVLIVEDERIIAEMTRSMLEELGYKVSGIAKNIAQATELITKQQFDLALLDINLSKGEEGILLGARLKQMEIPFVYITSYADEQTLKKAALTNPGSYIVKPFVREALQSAITITLTNHSANKREREEFILIDTGHKEVKVLMKDILFLKSDNIYVEVHTQHENLVERTSLAQLLEKLPASTFVRTHRSYAVNIEKVKSLNSDHLLIGVTKIPVSRANYGDVSLKFRVE